MPPPGHCPVQVVCRATVLPVRRSTPPVGVRLLVVITIRHWADQGADRLQPTHSLLHPAAFAVLGRQHGLVAGVLAGDVAAPAVDDEHLVDHRLGDVVEVPRYFQSLTVYGPARKSSMLVKPISSMR